MVFLDENGLVQRIPFDDKPGFHDLTLYRITKKGRELMKKFSRDPVDDWNKSTYSVTVRCQNCGYTSKNRVPYGATVKVWANTQRCPNCAEKRSFETKFD